MAARASGTAEAPLPSKSTVALLDHWQSAYPEYAQAITAFSKDDDTTARGWLRMNLNKEIADVDNGTNEEKADVARKIADWIRDAWTGPVPLASFATDAQGRNYQLYNDERLRLQIAANIVDYIDTDNVPTDLGDVAPSSGQSPIPVIGTERMPLLVNFVVLYQAKERSPVAGSNPAKTSAKMSMKFRFSFINLFDDTLDLQMPSRGAGSPNLFNRIEVQGVPVVMKLSERVFDKESRTFNVPFSTLRGVNNPGSSAVPAGVNGTPGSGVRTFETDWLVEDEPVQFRSASGNPIFESGQVTIKLFGFGDARLDVTAMTWNDTPSTGFRQSGTNQDGTTSVGDFLRDEPQGAIPGNLRQIAAMMVMETLTQVGSSTLTRQFADPRYRPALLNEKWRRHNRTDTEGQSPVLRERVDNVEMQPRTFAHDWYGRASTRPLAFIANRPLLSVGELGNVSAPEYPWRTIYLQHPERPSHSASVVVIDEVATKRRMQSQDRFLLDLFRVSEERTRSGSININTRTTSSTDQKNLAPLFLALPVGERTSSQQLLSPDMVNLLTTNTGSTTVQTVADRRAAPSSTLPENNPIRPYFQIGDITPALSRLFSTSFRHSSESGPSASGRSTVIYSVLRQSPETIQEINENYRSDMHVEQPFREISSSITTRGNVFRVLFVGQAVKDINRNGQVDPNETAAEFLGEAYVEREPSFTTTPPIKTNDSRFKTIWRRAITE